jgi:hypothetical protein
MRTILQSVLAALALTAGSASMASATDNWYGVVTINNPTNEALTYHFRWGDGQWTAYTLLPGEYRWHSWQYAYANQNSSPTPYVMFDVDMTAGAYWQEYYLVAYASPYNAAAWGKQYQFQIDWYNYLVDLVHTS